MRTHAVCRNRCKPVSFDQGAVLRCRQIDDIPKELDRLLGHSQAVLTSPDSVYGPHVQVNAFRPVDSADSRLVVHLVNYNVPLGVDAPPPVVQDGLALDIPLPSGLCATAAKAYTPGEDQPVDLSITTVNGRAQATLPPLTIYRVVEVTLTQ